MKLPNFTRLLYGLGEHTKKIVAEICHIKWNWIRLVKFEKVWIDFKREWEIILSCRLVSDFFSLLSSKIFATMATDVTTPRDNQIFKIWKAWNRGGVGGGYIWCGGYKIVECSAKFFQEDWMHLLNFLCCNFLLFDNFLFKTFNCTLNCCTLNCNFQIILCIILVVIVS